jgi:hypothetical protein
LWGLESTGAAWTVEQVREELGRSGEGGGGDWRKQEEKEIGFLTFYNFLLIR